MSKEKQRDIKGVRIRTANFFMIGMSCVLYILLLALYNIIKEINLSLLINQLPLLTARQTCFYNAGLEKYFHNFN